METLESEAIINFMYFGHNYPYDFIEQVWRDSISLHLREKFSAMYNRYGTQTFFIWYMELSNDNKAKLNNWVELYYNYKIN